MINKLGKLTRPGIRGSPLVAPHASRREIGGYLSSRFVPRVTKINTAGMSPTPPEVGGPPQGCFSLDPFFELPDLIVKRGLNARFTG